MNHLNRTHELAPTILVGLVGFADVFRERDPLISLAAAQIAEQLAGGC
jgi:hypothetical protein